MKRCLRVLLKTAKWLLVVLLLYVGSLFFRSQRIPPGWIAAAVDARAPTNIVFSCSAASFGFRQGLDIRGVRVYDKERKNPLEPVVAADSVSVDFFLRRVRVVALRVPRLGDSYYDSPCVERNRRVKVRLPKLSAFAVSLVRPQVLGVAPESVRATVKTTRRRIEVSDIRLTWPDLDRRLALNGFVSADFDEQRVWGEVQGEARQTHIRPLLQVLDVPSALPYMDAFTGVVEPVPSACRWSADLTTGDFRITIALHPVLGRYNGVPMQRADGEIDLCIYTRGTNLNYRTTVGPLVASDPKGRPLQGKLVVDGTNDVVSLDFDCTSALPLASLLSIADCFNDGTLDCLVCDTPPVVSVAGRLATDAAHLDDNDLRGGVSFERGALFGMPLRDVSFDYRYRGSTVAFTNVAARGTDGGFYSGAAALDFPGLDPEKATFSLSAECRGGSLAELADALGSDFGGRNGVVDGAVELTGPISTNFYPALNGRGRIRVADERLSQMKLFMGLTDYLAKNVPGVAGLVNQSCASADYTIVDGVIKSDNISIEGDVFSIKAWGGYDIPADKLDFTVRVQLLRNDSFFAKLVRPVTFPFTKLLMEFKVLGSAHDPKWEYVSVLDRIL